MVSLCHDTSSTWMPRVANLNRSRPICDVIIPRLLGGTDEMGYPRQCEGRPRGLSLAHPHVHRSRCGIPIRAGRRGGERGAQDRRHSVRCCRRRARSPRRGMFIRRDRQEIQRQGCGYQPPGVDRARGRHAAARSHTAVTRPRGDRGRIQAARRRAGLRRSRNDSPRAASLRCALSLLRRRPQQAAAGLTRVESHQPQSEKLAKPTCSTTANRTSQPVDCRSRSGDVRCSATNIGPCNDACCSWAPPPSARASPLAAAKLCLSWSRIPSNVEASACVRASRSARSRGSRFLPRISWKAGPCISSTFRARSSTPGTCHIRPACPATSPNAGPCFSTGALQSRAFSVVFHSKAAWSWKRTGMGRYCGRCAIPTITTTASCCATGTCCCIAWARYPKKSRGASKEGWRRGTCNRASMLPDRSPKPTRCTPIIWPRSLLQDTRFGNGAPGNILIPSRMASPRCRRRAPWAQGNSVEELPEGDILASYRPTSTVIRISRKTGKIVWKLGPPTVAGQHAPTLLENGNILIFDNGPHRLDDSVPYSRAIEVDPATNAIVWKYQDKPAWNFFSPRMGCAQRLPNGNTLITESSFGRFFEVTKEGEIVWEYVNPFFGTPFFGGPPGSESNQVFRAVRYSADEIARARHSG